MKNHFEIRGKACRVVFDPSTDQFTVETLAHPFMELKPAPVAAKAADVTELADRRRPRSAPVAKTDKPRRLA